MENLTVTILDDEAGAPTRVRFQFHTWAALSRRIQRYWTTFARSGVPRAEGPAWRPFDAAAPSAHRLSPAGAPARPAFAADHHCAFWTAYASGALG